MNNSTDDLRYPIGRFQPPDPITENHILQSIEAVEQLPTQIEQAILNLDATQLQTPYRPGGWTVQQVVHHVADSHMQAYSRFKLALTEDQPTIKPYAEDRWAMLPDSRLLPVEVSLTLLHALHRRWVVLMRHMSKDDWERTYYHPEQQRIFTLSWVVCMYAWHGRHHLMHILKLRERMSW
ncbi:MAG: putative metal-dependent hydrolase [Thermoflavifilum sp.]|nr:putative metal-dependent hydrolase [Thermoflavifilum sp.]